MRAVAPWALAGALALCAAAARAAPAEDMHRLLEEGRSAEAYALGRAHPEALGQADFDFYYGVAAIDSGHAGEGVLALERYIVRYPANDRARLELARGYFVLGELVRAREEFDRVASHNPPPDVQATIDRFYDSIRAQESRYRSSTLAYVEAGGGYDTNVNSGVRDPIIGVPSLGTVQLAPAGVETDSPFALLGAGVRGSRPVAPGVALLGGAALAAKLHSDSDARQFDQTELAAYGGASWLRHKDLLRATASLSVLEVDDARFRQTFALGGEWHRQLDELNTASLFAQYARLEYPSQDVRNADFFGLGVGWRRAFVARLQPVLELQALAGREQNDASPRRDDLSRDLATLRAAMAFTPAPRWGASLGFSYAASRFRESDLLFGVKREDDYYALELGGSYRVNRQVSVIADYQHLENSSSIALYEYNRDLVALRLRYEFK